MNMLLDQLETFAERVYTRRDYERFEVAAATNKQRINGYVDDWPQKFDAVKKEIVNA